MEKVGVAGSSLCVNLASSKLLKQRYPEMNAALFIHYTSTDTGYYLTPHSQCFDSDMNSPKGNRVLVPAHILLRDCLFSTYPETNKIRRNLCSLMAAVEPAVIINDLLIVTL